MTENKRLCCPLCFANSGLTDFYCVKESCAWWNRVEEACSILVISHQAARLVHRIAMEGRG